VQTQVLLYTSNMKNTTYYLVPILLAACGAGNPDSIPATTTSKVYPCDPGIAAEMAVMSSPYLLGLGEPDTTTYTSTGNLHTIIYQFSIARQRITLLYNTSQCKETVETY